MKKTYLFAGLIIIVVAILIQLKDKNDLSK